jgi:hypothetical protein
MRCDEVIRGLTESGRAFEGPDAMAAHLASCASCARAEREHRHLDAIWAASRPDAPPAGSFETIWAAVSPQVDGPYVLPILAGTTAVASATTGPATQRPRRWLLPALTVGVLAQAAALLIAVGTLLRPSPTGPSKLAPANNAPLLAATAAPATAPAQVFEFELEEGQTLFLELGSSGDRVVCRPRFVSTAQLVAFDGEDGPDAFAVAYQADITMLNVMEGMDTW